MLHHVVLPLGLTDNVPAEGGRGAVIDTVVGPNSVSQSTGKLFPTMGAAIVRYTSFADNVFEEHLC
jgi:hypothetical protein